MVVVKSSPTLIGLITFLFHTKVLGHDLTAATGFTALALFNQIRMPLTSLPETVNHYIQARVSFRRVEGFLRRSADDVNSSQEDGKPGSDRRCPDLARGQLKIENGEALFSFRFGFYLVCLVWLGLQSPDGWVPIKLNPFRGLQTKKKTGMVI